MAHERAPPFRESLCAGADPAGEVVRVIPGQADRPDPALVPLLKSGGITLQWLHALHREHSPQTRVLQLLGRADQAYPVRVSLDCAAELGLLRQSPFARPWPRRTRAVQRADLDADVGRLEPVQPVPLEHALRPVPQHKLERGILARTHEHLQ